MISQHCGDMTTIKFSDTKLIQNFLSDIESVEAFKNLENGNEITYQQWYHLPNKNNLLPLPRLKIAMANTDSNGWTPLYRFPVNNQEEYGIFPFSPTVDLIRNKLINQTGINFNHAVVLFYKDNNDCIGYHKDKLLDLSETDPIACISIGEERMFSLTDNIHNPKLIKNIILTNGSLLLLGPETNKLISYFFSQIISTNIITKK